MKNSLISVIFFSLLLIGSLGPTLKTRFFAESGSSVYETDLAKAALFLNSTQFDPMVGLCREAPIVHNTTYWLVSDNLLAYHALEYYYPETASVIYATMLGYGYFRSYKHEVVFGTTVPYIPFENATSLNVTQIGTKSVETEVDNGLPSINDTEHEDLCIYEALDYYWNGNTSQAIVSFNLAKSMWDGVGIHEPGFNGSYETYKLALLLYASRIIGQPLANQTGVEEVLWMMQDPNNGGLHTNYDVNFNYSGSDVNTETTSLAILAYRYTPAIVNRSGQNPPPLDVPPDFLTIQEAINHAKEGDTVYLFSGTYNEKVVVNVTVSLTGEDEDSTIIDGNGTGTVVTIGANFVSLSNLTIRNPGTVWVQGSWYIESCIQGSYLTNVTVKDVTCIGGAVPVWFDHSSCVNISDDAVTGGEYLGIGGYTLQNITICHNHVFNCTSTDGIHLDGGSRYCTVTNNTVTDCFDGITLETNDYSPWPTSDNLIDGNSIENITLASIGLFKCGTNVFRRNNMTGKQNNLVVWGSGPEAFVQDIDTSNTANGRVLYYLTNKSDLTIDPTDCPNAGDVVIANCTNTTIRDFDLSYCMDGILLAGSKDCSLMNITIGNNREPIVYQGVPLIYGGITLFESDNNTIANTKIYNNSYGVCQYHSDSNVFYHNSFINVHKPVISDYTSIFRNASSGYVSHAVWDNGVEGNFWSDYKGGDADHDGIGDAPYEIDGNNVDNHPLMGTYCEFLLSFFSNRSVAVTVISNSTVSDMAYAIWLSTPYDGLQPGQPFITFSVTGQNGTLGFCRLMFPRTVLNDSTYTVLVDSQRVNATEMSISNSTYVYLYFTYPHSAHEVMVTVPEFSWLVVPLFMIATLVAAIFYRRSIARNDLNDGNHSLVLTRFAIRELFGSAERQRF